MQTNKENKTATSKAQSTSVVNKPIEIPKEEVSNNVGVNPFRVICSSKECTISVMEIKEKGVLVSKSSDKGEALHFITSAVLKEIDGQLTVV